MSLASLETRHGPRGPWAFGQTPGTLTEKVIFRPSCPILGSPGPSGPSAWPSARPRQNTKPGLSRQQNRFGGPNKAQTTSKTSLKVPGTSAEKVIFRPSDPILGPPGPRPGLRPDLGRSQFWPRKWRFFAFFSKAKPVFRKVGINCPCKFDLLSNDTLFGSRG